MPLPPLLSLLHIQKTHEIRPHNRKYAHRGCDRQTHFGGHILLGKHLQPVGGLVSEVETEHSSLLSRNGNP